MSLTPQWLLAHFHLPSVSLSTHPISSNPSVHPPNLMCCPSRLAIAQHLPCLGVLLGVSGQRTGLYTSYRSTHRSTLSSQASDLSWISGRRRQASLGSESEVVRRLGPHWLASHDLSSISPASGLQAGLPLRLRNPQELGSLAGRAPHRLHMAFPHTILPARQGH